MRITKVKVHIRIIFTCDDHYLLIRMILYMYVYLYLCESYLLFYEHPCQKVTNSWKLKIFILLYKQLHKVLLLHSKRAPGQRSRLWNLLLCYMKFNSYLILINGVTWRVCLNNMFRNSSGSEKYYKVNERRLLSYHFFTFLILIHSYHLPKFFQLVS